MSATFPITKAPTIFPDTIWGVCAYQIDHTKRRQYVAAIPKDEARVSYRYFRHAASPRFIIRNMVVGTFVPDAAKLATGKSRHSPVNSL